ncbi:DUF3039 domain-containing protein [Promicromonospora panici]|uniref:DUF3039 domain-containing protein n=1 Tax=Promicromonospora panici TaxID=2219658 RepID=UPI00101BD5EE|nr:DUF3039 domain-containing protein [Promicromonospora panici]
MLSEDLTSGWSSPLPARALAEGDLGQLHPLSELPHPIITKAATSFAHDADSDNFVGTIASCTRLRLLEIKAGQWRGGVWQDSETNVNWLVVAGLAKGEHQDHDDFYVRVKKANDAEGTDRWLPTEADWRLLRQETAARMITEWELVLQSQMLEALRVVHDGGATSGVIRHPRHEKAPIAQFALSVARIRDDGYEADEIELELSPESAFAGSNLLWQATIRVLISLNPPEQGWDRDRNSFMTIAEPDTFTARIGQLERLVGENELGESVPGTHSHYAHRQHLAGHTIEGKAVRALCGVFFVPTQDHEGLGICSTCEQRYVEIPACGSRRPPR